MTKGKLSFRRKVKRSEREIIREIVSSSGFFSPSEINVALELLDDYFRRGKKSGYLFLLAIKDEEVVGYSCYGPVVGNEYNYNLYWIAVHKRYRHQGIGRLLLEKTETLIEKRGGKRIYVETASRPQYKETLSFYLDSGYRIVALLDDYYAQGDGKIILQKEL